MAEDSGRRTTIFISDRTDACLKKRQRAWGKRTTIDAVEAAVIFADQIASLLENGAKLVNAQGEEIHIIVT